MAKKITATVTEIENVVVELMKKEGFNGVAFVEYLRQSVKIRKRKSKEPKQIRYIHFTTWAVALKKEEIGPEDCEFTFPQCVLDLIRTLVPGNIKGEFREDAYRVDMSEFCKALKLPKLEEE